MKYNFLDWLKAAGTRAIKTFAQTAASLITVGALFTEIDWRMVASVAAVAAIYSLLTSIAGLPELDKQEEINEYKGVVVCLATTK